MATGIKDLLNPDLAQNNIRIYVEKVMEDLGFQANQAHSTKQLLTRSKTPLPAKSLNEFFLLVKKVIDDMELRAGTPEEEKVVFSEEEPDVNSTSEMITFSVVSRKPGSYSQGSPFEGKVVNLRPVPRESLPDPDNPGYNLQINGYYFDNLVKFTCWARTNKEANARAMWFENLMLEYSWVFKLQGIQRVIFLEREADIVNVVDKNKWYGRPLNYFVRTEKLTVFSEKTIEDIILRLKIANQ